MLTDLVIKKIKFDGTIKLVPDSDGLFLRVSKKKMRWQLSFMKDGKQCHFYGGYYPETPLKQAREWARATRETSTSANVDTMNEFSFGYYFEKYRNQQIKNQRSPATIKKLDMRKNKYLAAHLHKDIRTFTAKSVLNILEPIAEAGYIETLSQVREIMSNVFLHAVIEEVRTTNPVDKLYKVLPSVKEISRAAIIDSHQDVMKKLLKLGQLLRDIYNDNSLARIQTKKALQISPHLFVRGFNLQHMEWSEINLKNKMWNIPAHKMKGGKSPLDVPLSDQSLQIILDMKEITGAYKYVFGTQEEVLNPKPGEPRFIDLPLPEHSIRCRLIDLGYYGAHMKKVPESANLQSNHGFRAIARTTMDEVLEFRVDVIEHQLGHLVRDANGVAYNRTKHIEKRILMMQLWSNFLDVLREGNKTEIEKTIKQYKGLI